MENQEIASLIIQTFVALVMIIFGINQIKSPAGWLTYMPRFVRFILPVEPTTFMKLHGTTNIALGVLLFSGFQQPASVVMALVWWILILPFAFYYHWTVGLRDLAIIGSLAALLFLI